MTSFIYYFDCILQGSKFINVIICRMINIYLCLLLGNQNTNMVLGSFQHRGVLLLLHIVGQGPAVIAAGVGQVGYFFFII